MQALPEAPRERIIAALRALQDEPLSGKPLKGALEGSRSLRIGQYRVIYRISGRARQRRTEILKVGHRARIYGK